MLHRHTISVDFWCLDTEYPIVGALRAYDLDWAPGTLIATHMYDLIIVNREGTSAVSLKIGFYFALFDRVLPWITCPLRIGLRLASQVLDWASDALIGTLM